MTEILFVHGALVRDGAWWWGAVADLVQQSTGVESRAVLLPSCGEVALGEGSAEPVTDGIGGRDVRAGGGLIEDAAALRAALDQTDSAIVVGHSYGGTVVAQGADHPSTAHLLYVSSYLPEPGHSQAGIMSGEPDPVSIAAGTDGTVGIHGYDPLTFGERFWHDVPDEETRAAAWSRITPQSVAAFGTETTAAAWQGRDSTYLVCADDRSTSVGLQRQHAARATHAFDLPTSHHPFLSRPDLVAAHLERILAGL